MVQCRFNLKSNVKPLKLNYTMNITHSKVTLFLAIIQGFYFKFKVSAMLFIAFLKSKYRVGFSLASLYSEKRIV